MATWNSTTSKHVGLVSKAFAGREVITSVSLVKQGRENIFKIYQGRNESVSLLPTK